MWEKDRKWSQLVPRWLYKTGNWFKIEIWAELGWKWNWSWEANWLRDQKRFQFWKFGRKNGRGPKSQNYASARIDSCGHNQQPRQNQQKSCHQKPTIFLLTFKQNKFSKFLWLRKFRPHRPHCAYCNRPAHQWVPGLPWILLQILPIDCPTRVSTFLGCGLESRNGLVLQAEEESQERGVSSERKVLVWERYAEVIVLAILLIY